MSDLKHYLDSYANEDFINEYMEYLKNPNVECPYDDIDDAGAKDETFYKDLTEFLTKQLGDSGYEFKRPVECEDTFAIEFRDMENKNIYLRSDQFGFSALYGKGYKKSSSWKGKESYPYARYLSVNCDNDKGATDPEKIRFVASCIYETRTIGGSFIWPVVKRKRKRRNRDDYEDYFCSIYNRLRGEGSYIEDRVDITLYEISCFYHVYSQLEEKNYENFKKDYKDYTKYIEDTMKYPRFILFNSQDKVEKEAIYRWLSIFETFEGYVEKLKFKDFVIEDELYNLLKNIKKCTELRTKTIEDLLLK